MDINCTLNCSHQKEGKCRLEEVRTDTRVITSKHIDCPYYKDKGCEIQ